MLRGTDRWGAGYAWSMLTRPRRFHGTRHLILALCDHFEPYRGGADAATARGLVTRWRETYPAVTAAFRDADGRPPQHTFFYPAEEYDPVCLDLLTPLAADGHGEVEIHLHHRHDTPVGLQKTLRTFRDTLRDGHGLLGEPKARGRGGSAGPAYAFIHGNWALCNARPDGDWCGVNEELGILATTGCFADFTFPSAPSPTQPRVVNAIYRATDRPEGRGADRGERVVRRVEAEANRQEDGARRKLMLVQGPLGLNWRRRKWRLLPRLETAELSGANPPDAARLDLWARTAIGVGGRPDWTFVKLHTHGCVAANADVLLGPAMAQLHAELGARYNDGRPWRLHYVSARELYNIVRAAEDGREGEPGAYRDYEIAPPPCRSAAGFRTP